jgi:hypothetical protein
MIRLSLVCVVLAVVAGCGGSTPATNPEVASAHEVLTTVLDAWKNGSAPSSLASGPNPVQVSDPEWQAGAKLQEYRILKVGGEEEGVIACTVNLKGVVRGKEVSRTVNYRVILTPKRTVTRNLKE